MTQAFVLVLATALFASFVPCVDASDRDDAELELMVAERRGLDLGAPLRWHYAIVDVPQRELVALRAALVRLGLPEPSIPEQDAENDAGEYELWLDERRVHTLDSYAKRLAEVRAAARSHSAELGFWSVHPPDDG